MRDWAVLALSLAYLVALFAIAWIGDRRAKAAAPARAPATYALSIAVYCSSWTLYGAVGAASADGFDYFAIYVGPILVMGLGWRLIQRMARVARAENVPVFRRFSIMKHLVKSGPYTTDQLLAPDNFHLNDLSYGCLARLMAEALTDVVTEGRRTHVRGPTITD